MKLECNKKILDLSCPKIMAIINITPDSFFDGGCYNKSTDQVLNQIENAIKQGADIIDIGGESTRPGAQKISLEQEMDRVLPVLEKINPCPVVISLDTYKPKLMKEAVKIGIDMINDVKGLAYEIDQYQGLCKYNLAYCIMHMLGEPQTMQKKICYKLPIIDELNTFFKQRLDKAISLNFKKNQMVIDPGFGFGKTFEHNLSIVKNLSKLNIHKVPILIGLSNKSSIGQMIKNNNKEDRLFGSICANLISLLNGAKIIRVHQVKPHKDMLETLTHLTS